MHRNKPFWDQLSFLRLFLSPGGMTDLEFTRKINSSSDEERTRIASALSVLVNVCKETHQVALLLFRDRQDVIDAVATLFERTRYPSMRDAMIRAFASRLSDGEIDLVRQYHSDFELKVQKIIDGVLEDQVRRALSQ